MTWKPLGVFALLAVGTAGAQTPTTAPRPSWKPLEFLIGAWDAKTQGGLAGASSSGAYSFRLDLREHVLARHSATAGCAAPAAYDCEHADLLYIYPDAGGKSFKAIYFDNEGHVLYYDVSTPSDRLAVFLSDPAAPGPQFRLTYELKGSTMHGKFQMRML